MDIVSFEVAALRHLHLDCTVRNSPGQRYLEAEAPSTPGIGMRLASEDKAKRYPDKDGLHCITAAMDQCGFIGSEFLDMLQQLAVQADANDTAHARPSCNWLRKWLRQLSTAMAKVQASAIAQAAGAV